MTPRIPERARADDLSLATAVRNHVVAVLHAVGGSRSAAARLLDIERSSLQRMIKRWT